MIEAKDFDLTCWYLHQRRILELIGTPTLGPELESVHAWPDGQLRSNAELSIFKKAITDWLKKNNPPTLGKLIVKNELQPGSLFTLYTNFYCKGSGKAWNAKEKGKRPVPAMMIYAKLEEFSSGLKLECRFHHDHLTSGSSWTELSGQKSLFILAVVTDVADGKIDAVPYVIANPFPQIGVHATKVGQMWPNRFQTYIDSIDSFEDVKSAPLRRSKKELGYLCSIPEKDIKMAFANIIGEPTITKDWGGERSDLISDYVIYGGVRVATAFVFKGPSKFMPMTLAQLGKNGDQIERLFTEPADLFILQHCHEVTPPVKATMRAFAQQIGRLRLFCIIDGYDTMRLLRAYNQCGLSL